MMKTFFYSLCAAACIAAGAVSCGPAPSADEYLSKSIASAERAEWADALKYAKRSVDKAPGHAASEIQLILAMEQNNQEDEALTRAITAAEAFPDSFLANYTLGRMYCKQNKYEYAIRPLTIASELRPDDANTLVLLARAKSRQNIGDALDAYSKLVSLPQFSKNSVLYNEMAVLLVMQGKARKSLALMQQAITLDSANPLLYLNMAIINDYQLGDMAAARTYYSNFLRLASNQVALEAECLAVATRLDMIRGL